MLPGSASAAASDSGVEGSPTRGHLLEEGGVSDERVGIELHLANVGSVRDDIEKRRVESEDFTGRLGLLKDLLIEVSAIPARVGFSMPAFFASFLR